MLLLLLLLYSCVPISQAVLILLNASYSSCLPPPPSSFFFAASFVVDFFITSFCLLFLTRILHKFWFKTWLGNCSYVLSHYVEVSLKWIELLTRYNYIAALNAKTIGAFANDFALYAKNERTNEQRNRPTNEIWMVIHLCRAFILVNKSNIITISLTRLFLRSLAHSFALSLSHRFWSCDLVDEYEHI